MADKNKPTGGPWGGRGKATGTKGIKKANGGAKSSLGKASQDSPWGNAGGQQQWGQKQQSHYKDDFEHIVSNLKDNMSRFSGGGRGGNNGGTEMPIKFGGKAVVFGLLVAILLWLATGFYTVKPNEQGVELLFGKVYDSTNPGLQYFFPAPIGEILLPSVTEVNQEQIGFREVGGQNTGASKRKIAEEGLMLTGDENIIEVEFVVFWKIRDAGKFLFNLRNPQGSVKNASEAAMREIIGKTDFEYARTAGRTQLSLQAKELIQNILDQYQAGIEVLTVNLQSIDPPSVVLGAFRDVQAAKADKERAINEATAYLNEAVERARGEAEQITQSAEAYKEEQIAIAEGDAERFLSIYEEYRQAKSITKRRIYLQTMEEILQNMNKILIEENANGQGVVPYLPLDRLTNNNKANSNQ